MPRPKSFPDALDGVTIKEECGCGDVYLTINDDPNGRPYEVFPRLGKAGGCTVAFIEAIGRLIAMYIQRGGKIENVRVELGNISCHRATEHKPSCIDAIAKAIGEIKK